LGDNRFVTKMIEAGHILVPGTVLGVLASGELAPAVSANSDGSQHARYILFVDIDTDAGGAALETRVVRGGRIDASKLVFDGADDLSTKPTNSDDSYNEQLRNFNFDVKHIVQNSLTEIEE